ncbi:alpha/beta fold hydrolase [Rhodanobacter sp. Col0626]|uniref:alpha/beta fold hydrolase n=1 Tax=Rhodanobacter sp. Col0626 TaxID=3415679 RepID=UPI003CE724DF
MRKFHVIHRMICPLLALAWLAGAAAVQAQEPVATDAVGTLKVERFGNHGQPVILVPGLTCGTWEWRDTITQLQKSHVVYAVTLAGFDGTAAPTGDRFLDQADASLLKLIRDRHIHKPVLVGHSIGGTLSLRFAGEHADLIAGVVAVDGLPVFPGMDRVSTTQREAIAAKMAQKMAGVTQDQYPAFALGYMQHMGVIDPQLAARHAPEVARSDIKAAARYMQEDMASDYRPGLSHASVPILEISPYYAADFEKAAAMSKQPLISEPQKTAYYASLLKDAPNAKVVSIAPSRHFVMLDQPAKFQRVLDGFLKTL